MAGPIFRLTGDKALVSALAELGKTFGGPALDASVKKGMDGFHQAAKANLVKQGSVYPGPRSWPGWNKPGAGQHLYQSLRIRKTPGRPRHSPEFRLGFVGRGRGIAHLVEFGTAPHYQPNLRWMHPGARPFPFMRPAFDVHGHRIIGQIMVEMRDQVMKAAAALRGRYGGK